MMAHIRHPKNLIGRQPNGLIGFNWYSIFNQNEHWCTRKGEIKPIAELKQPHLGYIIGFLERNWLVQHAKIMDNYASLIDLDMPDGVYNTLTNAAAEWNGTKLEETPLFIALQRRASEIEVG